MKKITLLCLADRRDSSLKALRDLGVVHVQSIQPPAGSNIDSTEARIAKAQRCLQVWDRLEAEEPARTETSNDPIQLVEKLNNLADKRQSCLEKRAAIQREITRVEPFGDFDPDLVKDLAEDDIEVRLYEALATREYDIPENLHYIKLNEVESRVYFCLAGYAKDFPEDFPIEQVTLPHESLGELREKLSEARKSLEDVEKEICELVKFKPSLEHYLSEEQEELEFLSVREGMGSEERFAWLEGFCPEENVEAVQAAAAEHGWGIVVNDPDPEDNVPTQLRFPGWVKPIKALLDFLSITPGYREADVSTIFLLFFSVFFGILIGDAGYGALMLGGVIFARVKLRKAPSYPFTLFSILAVCTIVWGVLTGNYFGITDLPAPLASMRVNWLSNENPDSMYNIMGLCFLIGAIQLTIAHGWNVLAYFPRLQFLAQIGWAGVVWTMYFTIGFLVLQQPFPPVMFYVFGASVVLIILFMTPPKQLKEEWINHVMLPLDLISCGVDIISYVRLFAVGMATLALADSFNDMAMQAGFGSVLSGAIAVLIIVFGHTLNIILGALAVLVHGVRLNTLEFSMHKDLTWAGYRYAPFSRKEHSKSME
ncbi:MAG: V-type ATP synthase subunit I [Candidatus Sumerlaeia bacterium]